MTSSTPYTESYIVGPQNTQFYTRTYSTSSSNPKALLIAVHGFNEHIGRFTHFHASFSQRSIAVFAFDQRGFGLTAQKKQNGGGKKYAQTSWREQLEDIEWAVTEGRRVKGCEDVPVFMMGNSMVSLFKIYFSAVFLMIECDIGRCPNPRILNTHTSRMASPIDRNGLTPLWSDRIIASYFHDSASKQTPAVDRDQTRAGRSPGNHSCCSKR